MESKNKYCIELNDSESALVESIALDVSSLSHREMHEVYKANKRPILSLLKSLSERSAIPQVRLSYWRDPTYNTSNPRRSHKGVFEKNGCTGTDIYTHPRFLPFLRYFLFGTDLPEPAISKFEEKVDRLEPVTSGDYESLRKLAMSLVRQYRLERNRAAEEFFKLCLDVKLGLIVARYVRKGVMNIRRQ